MWMFSTSIFILKPHFHLFSHWIHTRMQDVFMPTPLSLSSPNTESRNPFCEESHICRPTNEYGNTQSLQRSFFRASMLHRITDTDNTQGHAYQICKTGNISGWLRIGVESTPKLKWNPLRSSGLKQYTRSNHLRVFSAYFFLSLLSVHF